jgi:hypothetical protein
MVTPNPQQANPDTRLWEAALREWNLTTSGSADPRHHKPLWRLTPREWSHVAQIAQRMKAEVTLARVETDPPC